MLNDFHIKPPCNCLQHTKHHNPSEAAAAFPQCLGANSSMKTSTILTVLVRIFYQYPQLLHTKLEKKDQTILITGLNYNKSS